MQCFNLRHLFGWLWTLQYRSIPRQWRQRYHARLDAAGSTPMSNRWYLWPYLAFLGCAVPLYISWYQLCHWAWRISWDDWRHFPKKRMKTFWSLPQLCILRSPAAGLGRQFNAVSAFPASRHFWASLSVERLAASFAIFQLVARFGRFSPNAFSSALTSSFQLPLQVHRHRPPSARRQCLLSC